MGRPENEGVGSRDPGDVPGLELVGESHVDGRVAVDAHRSEHALLDVLGAVAVHLIRGDLDLVRFHPGDPAVDPQPAAPAEVDQQRADPLYGNEIAQRIAVEGTARHDQRRVMCRAEAGPAVQR